jgi:hypothetical protein
MLFLASVRVVAVGAAAFLGGAFAARHHIGETPNLLTASAGWVDVRRHDHPAAELGLGYRRGRPVWAFRPFVSLMVTTDRALYGWTGIAYDLGIGPVTLTPSFGPGLYSRGRGIDLGHPLEFRSQIEAAFRLNARSRIGLSFSHMSNAHLSRTNPGTETLALDFALTVGGLRPQVHAGVP